MWGVSFDRFADGRKDVQEMPYNRCDTCGEQMSASAFLDDVCDDCAVKQGFLSREEEA